RCSISFVSCSCRRTAVCDISRKACLTSGVEASTAEPANPFAHAFNASLQAVATILSMPNPPCLFGPAGRPIAGRRPGSARTRGAVGVLRLQEAHEALHVFLGQTPLLLHEAAQLRVLALPGHGARVVGDDGLGAQVLLDVQELMGCQLVRHGQPPPESDSPGAPARHGDPPERQGPPSGRRPAVSLPCPRGAMCGRPDTFCRGRAPRRARQEFGVPSGTWEAWEDHLGHGTRRVRWPSCPRRRGRWKATFWCPAPKASPTARCWSRPWPTVRRS